MCWDFHDFVTYIRDYERALIDVIYLLRNIEFSKNIPIISIAMKMQLIGNTNLNVIHTQSDELTPSANSRIVP